MKKKISNPVLRKRSSISNAGQIAYASVSAKNPLFKVCYFIPHAVQDMKECSPMGWFTPGLHSTSGLIMTACTLPADIREPFTQLEEVMLWRQNRHIWPHVMPIQLDAVAELDAAIQTPFRVYLTNEKEIADSIDQILKNTKVPYLHVSTIPGGKRIPLLTFDTEKVLNYVDATLTTISAFPEWDFFVSYARETMDVSERRSTKEHLLPQGMHNLVAPNELALASFGFRLRAIDPVCKTAFGGGVEPEIYVERICQSADAVSSERRKLTKRFPDGLVDYRYIVALPGMYWGHYENWRKTQRELGNSLGRTAKKWFKNVVHSKTYFETIDTGEDSEAEVIETYTQLNQSRVLDRRSFTSGITYLASATLSPVLRLEPRLYEIRAELQQLAIFSRKHGNRNVDWKQSRLYQQLCRKMRSSVAVPFLNRIDDNDGSESITGLKLVGDLPLELMPSNGVSLAMRFDVSRLPSMPGNAYLINCLSHPIFLDRNSLQEILIVRSFQDDDPLKPILENSIQAVKHTSTHTTTVRFVDVQNEDEFVNAINGHSGACMIFDGHGQYDSSYGAGMIVVGGKAVDLWQLKTRCTLPPIVILSACDMQPMDGSHSSTATAAFALGAHTVLAPSVPIDGYRAAALIARLLHRISDFIPAALAFRKLLTWREVIAGMLRMTHVTEIMICLMQGARVPMSKQGFDAVQLAANMAINSRNHKWYEIFMLEYSKQSGKTIEELSLAVYQYSALTESMKYVQLGSPENIILMEENPQNIFDREVEKAEKAKAG